MTAPTIRKRDAEATRARILEAAQRAFSETGYSHTGIRQIAAMAGVSSTLVLRYFGSKAGLFEEALQTAMPVATAISGPREELGANLAAALLDPANSIRPPLMIALASGDPHAAAIAARVFESHSIAPVAAWLGEPHGRVRAFELAMLATGLVFYLRQLPLEPLAQGERDHVTRWFEDAVTRIVSG